MEYVEKQRACYIRIKVRYIKMLDVPKILKIKEDDNQVIDVLYLSPERYVGAYRHTDLHPSYCRNLLKSEI